MSEMTQARMQAILDAEARAVSAIPYSEAYPRAIATIAALRRSGGKLVTSGMGKAGQIALNIATTCSSTGTPAVFLHPSEAQHGDLGVLQPHDVLLLLSNSGKTREILELLDLASALNPDVPTIVITGKPDSPLAERAGIALSTAQAPEVCPHGLTPTTSTTMMTVIGDILVVGVMEAIGFTAADYALRHHGGYLGSHSRELAADAEH